MTENTDMPINGRNTDMPVDERNTDIPVDGKNTDMPLDERYKNMLVNERYRIESKIGVGGMAEVFKAYDLIEKKYVAIKVIKKEYCVNPQYMRRFEREARTVLNLKHRNIVGAYEYGTYMGRGYIVLEYVKGCTLKEYILNNGALDAKTAVRFIAKILDALEYAHAQGYIHRDVKPQNVLLTEDKNIKLTDFGIAKETDSQTRTYDGNHVIGSVHYISPEQAKGEVVGKESDLYSAGIILYELLVGKPPFEGDNSVQIAIKHINDTLTLPEELHTKVPPALNDVLIKATAKNREKRYHSAADMKKDLIRALTQPKKHFAFIEDDEPAENGSVAVERGKTKMTILHIVLPIAFTLIFFGIMFAVWYAAVNSKPSGIPKVPELLGLDIKTAEERAHNRDYKLIVAGEQPSEVYPEGTVCLQEPKAWTPKEAGSIIEVTLSTGSEMVNETVNMIDLTGRTLEEAVMLLSEIDISIDIVTYSQSDAESGTIIWQSIAAEDAVMRGDTVDVQVSGTDDMPLRMPDLTVKNIGYAVNLLKTYGISDYRIRIAAEEALEADKTYINGAVIFQTPSAGIPVIPSSTNAELVIYLNRETAAKADFSSEIMVPADNSAVTVVLLSELGEVIIYETEANEGMQNLHFDAYYLINGQYICIVYVNGEEALRVERLFSGAITEIEQILQEGAIGSKQR